MFILFRQRIDHRAEGTEVQYASMPQSTQLVEIHPDALHADPGSLQNPELTVGERSQRRLCRPGAAGATPLGLLRRG